jgi:hypothetical protein
MTDGSDCDDDNVLLKPLTADDDDDDDENSDSSDITVVHSYLRIKSSYGDMEIEIPDKAGPKTTSVAQLKVLVRKALSTKEAEKKGGLEQLEDRYLRLICKGRLLSPDECFLSEFKVAENDVVHAVLGAPLANRNHNHNRRKGNITNNNAIPQSQQPQQRRNQRQRDDHTASGTFQHIMQQHQRRRRQRPNRGIGTIVGPGGRVTRSNGNNDNGNNSDDDYENDPERGLLARERRGFDRLRGAGLSRQEITAIRTYFNRHVDRYVVQQQQQQQQAPSGSNSGSGSEAGTSTNANTATPTPPSSTLHLDEPDLRRRRLMVEEEWMTTQGSASEFRLNLNQNTLMRFAALTANGMTINGANTRNSSNSTSAMMRERPGSDRDFMWGFCLGFFVGVISLVWVWMPTIPHKQKLGILTGICFQIILETSTKENYEDVIVGE